MPILGILASSTVTAAGDYESIATVTVGSGGSSSITFSSIPSTYAHLQIRGIARSGITVGATTALIIQINGNSTITDYATHLLDGNGSSASAYGAADDFPQTSICTNNQTSDIFGAFIIDILDVNNTNKYKTIRAIGGNDNNGSGNIRFSSGALYSNTNAISSITLVSAGSANLLQHSTFALYGIKSA